MDLELRTAAITTIRNPQSEISDASGPAGLQPGGRGVTHAVARSSDRFETLSARARNQPEARRSGESPLPSSAPTDHWVSLRKEKIRQILTCLVPSAN